LIPGKIPDENIQREFVDKYNNLLEQAKAGNIHLLFFDPTHQVHNTVSGKCWQAKGKEGTVMLSSNTGRNRTSILGAINACGGTFSSIITEDNCDTDMIKIAFHSIRNSKEYRNNKKIVIILDNAPYNRSYETQRFAKKLGIELKYLPPYSPNLNLIERVWKFFKKIVLKNKYYKSFKDFLSAIETFLLNIGEYRNDVASLLNQKFEIIKAA
jgi:transposase